MNKSFILFFVITLMILSCNTKKNVALNAGIRMENLDTLVSHTNDFYQFACGGWMKNNPLTGEFSRFGSFDKLAQNNLEQLKGLIAEIASKPTYKESVDQKIGDLYNIAMDSIKLNKDGYSPIDAELKRIASIKNISQLSTLLPDLLLSGLTPYFSVFIDADAKSSNDYLVQTYQGGISLGEREYYLDTDSQTVDIRNKYKEHVVKMFELVGFTPEIARTNMDAVLRIETRLASAAFDQIKLRDPQANYNKMTVEELQQLVPSINWKQYLTSLGLVNTKFICVSQKESLIEVGEIIEKESLNSQIAYLQWKLINQSANYLSDDIYAESFNFFGETLSGKTEHTPRWKRAVYSVDGSLGEAVGQRYVNKYFPFEAKERMLDLVHNLQISLGERIKSLSWMSDTTKVKALDKLNSFIVKVGYPDKWRDYSDLNIKTDSYYANIIRANRFESAYMFAKAGKKVDKSEWFMTPQTVNAYYNPSSNEICFPAGILQYPFFDMNADDAFNYGAIGVVIGHEMTHGFDDQGCQYDKNGNLVNWWTASDKVQFENRSKVLSDFFDTIEVAPGVKANGKFTLGENIADHGGLQISFQAFKNATKDKSLENFEGFTSEQRFFISYANVWAGNIRPEEILLLTKSDPHSLGKWRVNAALPHIQAWYDAFGIKEGNEMFIPVEMRVSIW